MLIICSKFIFYIIELFWKNWNHGIFTISVLNFWFNTPGWEIILTFLAGISEQIMKKIWLFKWSNSCRKVVSFSIYCIYTPLPQICPLGALHLKHSINGELSGKPSSCPKSRRPLRLARFRAVEMSKYPKVHVLLKIWYKHDKCLPNTVRSPVLRGVPITFTWKGPDSGGRERLAGYPWNSTPSLNKP